MVGGVTGGVESSQSRSFGLDPVPFSNFMDLKLKGVIKRSVGHLRDAQRAVLGLHGSDTPDVVGVPMRENDFLDLNVARGFEGLG